ncbi:MAG: helix-turn-helix domain-containing protein [Gemmatimonadota bacterium]
MALGSPKTRPTILPRLATAEEIAAELGIARPTVYRLCRSETIPHVRIGRRIIRFDLNAVAEWLQAGGSLSAGRESGS